MKRNDKNEKKMKKNEQLRKMKKNEEEGKRKVQSLKRTEKHGENSENQWFTVQG